MTKNTSNEEMKFRIKNHEDRITRIENKIDNIEKAVVKVNSELEFITKSIDELKDTINSNSNRTILWASISIPLVWSVLSYILNTILKVKGGG